MDATTGAVSTVTIPKAPTGHLNATATTPIGLCRRRAGINWRVAKTRQLIRAQESQLIVERIHQTLKVRLHNNSGPSHQMREGPGRPPFLLRPTPRALWRVAAAMSSPFVF